MNIYKLTQEVNVSYDSYDSVIVCARSAKDAKTIHPSEYALADWWVTGYDNGDWCTKLKDVNVEYRGKAAKGLKRGVILASFNAG